MSPGIVSALAASATTSTIANDPTSPAHHRRSAASRDAARKAPVLLSAMPRIECAPRAVPS
jgi:hypothetical protein